MKNLICTCMFFITMNSYSQLEYIQLSDSLYKYDKVLKCKIFPKFDIKIDSTNSVFFNKKCIFKPENQNLVHYEIFDKKFLFITIMEEKCFSVSIPLFIPRKNIFIIEIKNPKYILYADFKEINIARNKDEITKISNLETRDFFYILDINESKIRLMSNNNQLKEIYLEKKLNIFFKE